MDIRIYIEGGGDAKDSKRLLRTGFDEFFKDLKGLAREKRAGWNVVMCGSRDETFSHFSCSIRNEPDVIHILLVDSEDPITTTPLKHLKAREKSWSFSSVKANQCHLMVQTMESWLVADRQTIAAFYGKGFLPKSIPPTINVEMIDKDLLENVLKNATKNTRKGEYHKIKHASKLLGLIDPQTVRAAAPHCDRFFTTVEKFISNS